MSFAVVTDSLAGLPLEEVASRGLVVIPLSYYMNGEEHTCQAPEEYDSAAFFRAMKQRVEVKTAMIPPQRFAEYWEPLLQSELDILFLSASSGISSSYQSASIAAQQLEENYPERKIRVVDTLSSTLGEGLLVLRAFALREKGMSLDETADTILSLRPYIAHYFTVDDLLYISRGGRVSGAKALLGTVLLLLRCAALSLSPWHVVSFLIYGVSMVGLYTASTLYHCRNVSVKGRIALRKYDHASIYFLIAGTYTPICLVVLRTDGAWGWALFGVIWALALAGLVLTLAWITAPRWLTAGIYIFMGWLAVVALVPLLRLLPPAGFFWVLGGGILYTVGGVLYAVKWPGRDNPRFGCHEIFHLFILMGSVFHFMLMYRVVAFL